MPQPTFPDPNLMARLQLSLKGVEWAASLLQQQQHDAPHGGWSPHKQVFHMLGVETMQQPRIRRMLAEDRPVFERWDREVHLRDHYETKRGIMELVATLVAAREEMVAVFKGLTLEQWRRTATWPESGGEVDVAWAAERMLWHSIDHFGGLLSAHLGLEKRPAEKWND